MEKTKIEVYKLGDVWAIRQINRAGTLAGKSAWPTMEEAVDVALAMAEELHRQKGESVDIYYEEMGRFVLYNKGFRHFS